MPNKPLKRTPRGFAIYTELKDCYGHLVRIIHSSSAQKDAVWIFCEPDPHQPQAPGDTEERPRPHLTVPQAKRVVHALNRFIKGER